MITLLFIHFCLFRDDPTVTDDETTVVRWYQFDVTNDLPRSYVLEIPNINIFLSTDEGKTWQLHNRFSSTTEKFRVVTYTNGVYWVARQYVRHTGEVHPQTSALEVYDKVKVDVLLASEPQVKPTETNKPKTTETVSSSEPQSFKYVRHKRIKWRRCR